MTIDTGFPQGGVCSTKFWIIAYNQAIHILNTHGVSGYGFADDSCTLIGGQNLNQRMSRTQKVIDDLVFWGHSCGPKFNLDKTVCIIFTKAKTITDLPNKLTVSEKSVDLELLYKISRGNTRL